MIIIGARNGAASYFLSTSSDKSEIFSSANFLKTDDNFFNPSPFTSINLEGLCQA